MYSLVARKKITFLISFTFKLSLLFQAEGQEDKSDRPRNSFQFSFEDPQISAQDVGEQKYCTNQRCKQEAENMMDKMDQTVNPCDDFYKFACGGYLAKTTIPDDRPYTSRLSVMTNELNEQVKCEEFICLFRTTDIPISCSINMFVCKSLHPSLLSSINLSIRLST